jgi:hypothetical protein
LIERAYRQAPQLGLMLECEDEAGPFTTTPYDGASWEPQSQPARQAHEYLPDGTAKLLTLLHPMTGHVRAKGVSSSTNAVLLAWLKAELAAILSTLPPIDMTPRAVRGAHWEIWQDGLTIRPCRRSCHRCGCC